MRRIHALSFAFAFCAQALSAATLHVGSGQAYPTLPDALRAAAPGDTILIHGGTCAGGVFFSGLRGTASRWIHIAAAPGESAVFEGGSAAWHFSDAAFVRVSGITFRRQTGNGLNIDDGGSYETPAHHLVFEACVFCDISARGNNDLLKLSGVDGFEVRNCVFQNGSPGGSGIDMVGCHDGIVTGCRFENMGSNSVQVKGGSRNVRIEANLFRNGGQRALNLGGSTDLEYFRPRNAPYEAAGLLVYSNIFVGSQASVAFVGCVDSEVANNTIYLPGKWVLRILQESVDPSRFIPCGRNAFRNNIVFRDGRVSVDCNIGPDTDPESFTFENNLWHHSQDPDWRGPRLPVPESGAVIGKDPLFIDPAAGDFRLLSASPAARRGSAADEPRTDFAGFPFAARRSIGAFEAGSPGAKKPAAP